MLLCSPSLKINKTDRHTHNWNATFPAFAAWPTFHGDMANENETMLKDVLSLLKQVNLHKSDTSGTAFVSRLLRIPAIKLLMAPV